MTSDEKRELKRWAIQQIKSALRSPPTEAEYIFESWRLSPDGDNAATLLVKTDTGMTEAFHIKITEVR